GTGPETHLLTGPSLAAPYGIADDSRLRRVLDLRAGVLHETVRTDRDEAWSVRFSSLARPRTVALRASSPVTGPLLVAPTHDGVVDEGTEGTASWMRVTGAPGGI